MAQGKRRFCFPNASNCPHQNLLRVRWLYFILFHILLHNIFLDEFAFYSFKIIVSWADYLLLAVNKFSRLRVRPMLHRPCGLERNFLLQSSQLKVNYPANQSVLFGGSHGKCYHPNFRVHHLPGLGRMPCHCVHSSGDRGTTIFAKSCFPSQRRKENSPRPQHYPRLLQFEPITK